MPFMKLVCFVLLWTLFPATSGSGDFISGQKAYSRVRDAIETKSEALEDRLRKYKLSLSNVHILIAAYKNEQELDIYVKRKNEHEYGLLATYTICAPSGVLGPKRKAGDRQVPEGFYHIDRFNPSSSYYLSLGLNYPNQSDKIRKTAQDAGGDIFIHGSCVTIGCMPMTDDKIKELYLYAIHAKNNGQQNIPVYVFPFRMSAQNMQKFAKAYSKDEQMLLFWNNLRTGYDRFITSGKALNVGIDKLGNYTF
jgi:murein L,D-transpeptidase YafK